MELSRIKSRLDQKKIQEHVRFLCGFEKVSGSPGADRAAEYIADQLRRYGIKFKLEAFDEYLSNPVSSSVELPEPGLVLPSRPRSFSLNCPEGVEGLLVFDPNSQEPQISDRDLEAFYKTVRGKIVVAIGDSEHYCKKLDKLGALAWIQIWPSDEDILHEDTISAVWGTPTSDTSLVTPSIPVAAVTYNDGQKLIEAIKKGPVRARVRTEVDTGVFPVKMPVAEIPGSTDDFVLASCHYDTWYVGAFDNVAANAAAIELARAFHDHKQELRRGIRIAWWTGHSNGRYAGSTWYCDNYWKELSDHCIAHITADLMGSGYGEVICVKTTGTEGRAFIREAASVVDPDAGVLFSAVSRRGEQSFFGADIPFHFYLRYEKAPEKRTTHCPGGAYWWHTTEDTLDKIDFEVLRKDSELWYLLLYRLAADKFLPFAADEYFDAVINDLEDADRNSEDEFSFSGIIEAFKAVRLSTVRALAAAKDNDLIHNGIVCLAGGVANRLRQSYGSPYDQDMAYEAGLFPRLCAVKGKHKKDMSPENYLFMKTDFIRQKNRLLAELPVLKDQLDKLAEMASDKE